MKKVYRKEVRAGLNRTNSLKHGIISENDLKHLPPMVKKYLNYVDVVGRETLFNVRIKFVGRIRANRNCIQ